MKSLLITLVSLFHFFLHAQNEELVDCMVKHGRAMEIDEINFDLLKDRKLDQYSFFVSGEAHGVPLNPIYKLSLFKYVYQNAGVRTIVMEAGHSDAYLLNKFLETGDENHLRGFYRSVDTEFWRGLKSFNDSQTDKVKIIGIDFERSAAIAIVFDLIFGDNIPSEIKQNIEALKTIQKGTNVKEKKRIFSQTSKMLEKDSDHYQSYLGADYDLFVAIVKNKVPFVTKVKRDKEAVQNFYSYHSSHPDEKYFAQYGFSHVNRNFGNLTGLLNNDETSPMKGKTMVLMPQYFNCKAIYPDKSALVDGFGIFLQEDIPVEEIRPLFKEPFVLIDLSKLSDQYKELKAATDYIMLIQNQGT